MFVVPGFVSATELRPADVLTSALGNAEAVLEVPSLLIARLRPHMLVMQHNSEPSTSNTWTAILIAWRSYRGSNPRSTVLPHAQDASGADVTWRRKSHSTRPSTTRPPLKCGHALPRPIRSCWRVAELPPDILHDSLACCSILVPISARTFFFLVSFFLLSGCFPVALSVSAPITLLLSCALGASLSALGAAGRLVLSLSLTRNRRRTEDLSQTSRARCVGRERDIARWRVACAKVAPQSASEPGASLRLQTNLGSLFVVLFSPVFSDSTVFYKSRCAS